MNSEQLSKLLQFYRRALQGGDIDKIARSVQLLERGLQHADTNTKANQSILQQLERVHSQATDFIQTQMTELQTKMAQTHSHKLRDVAYAQTQRSQNL